MMNQLSDPGPGLLPAPEALGRESRSWAAALVEAAGADLRALYLYGSALAPGFDPAKSDVNLLLVVQALDFDRLDALAHAASKLKRPRPGSGGTRFTPIVLTEEQIRESADVFPMDLLDLLRRRALLEGSDVIDGLTVAPGDLRRHSEYELRTKLVGLRQGYIRAGAAPGAAHEFTLRAAGGAATLYRHLLALAGRPEAPTSEALAEAVARAFGVDAAGLAAPFLARKEGAPPDEALARKRFAAFLDALDSLTHAVDGFAAR